MAEIIEKLEIRSKEFSIDEGVYPRVGIFYCFFVLYNTV